MGRIGTRPVEELLDGGGWMLSDPHPRRAANPETFELPDASALSAVLPGHTIRAIFEIVELADASIDERPPWNEDGTPNLIVGHERMWLWVHDVAVNASEPVFVGILQNVPVGSHTRLEPGMTVLVPAHMVIEIDDEPPVAMSEHLTHLAAAGFPLRPPEDATGPIPRGWEPVIAPAQTEVCRRFGVRPERPAPHLTQFVVSENLTPGANPVYGARFRPKPGRGDSGWMIWAELPDLDDERLGPLSIITLGELMDRRADVFRYLALPPGWAFVLGDGGFEDVYQDHELLDP